MSAAAGVGAERSPRINTRRWTGTHKASDGSSEPEFHSRVYVKFKLAVTFESWGTYQPRKLGAGIEHSDCRQLIEQNCGTDVSYKR